MTSYYKDDKGVIYTELFICPECGNKNDKTRGYEFFAKNLELTNPWYTEFEFVHCMSCKRSIPGTLGYRYGDECKNYDDAKRIWQVKFKNLYYEWIKQ